MVETFIITSRPTVAKKISVISFSPPFSLLSFSFLVLVLATKHRSNVTIKLGSSRDNWYPIDNAIVVMCKVSTCQSLIKFHSYSQLETYMGSLLHSCKLGRLICQYHYSYVTVVVSLVRPLGSVPRYRYKPGQDCMEDE